MRRGIGQYTQRPFLTTGCIHGLRRIIIRSIDRIMYERLINTLMRRLIIRSITLSGRIATGRIISIRLSTQLCLRTGRMLLTINSTTLRFLLQRDRQINRLTTYIHIMLRILGLNALDLGLFQHIRDSMDLINDRRLLCVFLVCTTTLTLSMQAVLTTRTRTLIRLSTRPTRQLSSVLLDTQCRAIKINILSTRCRITTILTDRRVIMRYYTRTASIRHSY